MKCHTCFRDSCDCVIVEDRLLDYLKRGGVRALYQVNLAGRQWFEDILTRPDSEDVTRGYQIWLMGRLWIAECLMRSPKSRRDR